MTDKETLEEIIDVWQKRQLSYEQLAEDHIYDEHTYKKFKYKALATRDCWKELLTLIESENE